ncbi:hypothetical protein V498_08026 [Pseudogymnoascus sp. VKM F-4517 (FW-2822)]|nr:hypothetical protein V498_08026 [Pseudogymnoascus sp. VKM F-4517 (FW-2822)]
MMKRTLLLCFIHGFKGDTATFYGFPEDIKSLLSKKLAEDKVELLIYPRYETKGDLSHCTGSFLEWLKEKVINIRKESGGIPWPPNDRSVGVILVAHSMGGFVASDTLFSILSDQLSSHEKPQVAFPLIQGILTFDTPYNGLARSMFVYGGFSQYQKVSNVWNIMSAAAAGLTTAGALGRTTLRSSGSSGSSGLSVGKPQHWKIWQKIAINSGTAGAIAAGGVTAYANREKILKDIRNINKTSVKEGYEQGCDALGQGLAYINRDCVGQSFAWLSSHLKFVGALTRQKELMQRLERLSSIQGVGIRNLYCSLGENGYWTGGYFVPERTFCAVPTAPQNSRDLFAKIVNTVAEDEIQAHMSMFKPECNDGYDKMLQDAGDLIVKWFEDESEIIDSTPPLSSLAQTTSAQSKGGPTVLETENIPSGDDVDFLEESPLDIAAAAALVPLPDEVGNELEDTNAQKYLKNLFRIAQKTGIGLKSLWPSQANSLHEKDPTDNDLVAAESPDGPATVDADDDIKIET